MCRLFGTIADSPVSVEDPVLKGIKPFIGLSHKHHDGWGIGYVDGLSDLKSASIVKSPHPAYRDKRFSALVKEIKSPLIIAHLREAKHGEISFNNTHPFYSQSWIFAHNGSMDNFREIEKEIEGVDFEGETDSERYFYLILEHIRQQGSVKQGIRSAIQWLQDNRIEGGKNFLMSNGEQLYAYRYGRDLSYTIRKVPFVIDNYSAGFGNGNRPVVVPANAKMVMIASEPLTSENWQEVPEGHLVVVDESLNITVEQVIKKASEEAAMCC